MNAAYRPKRRKAWKKPESSAVGVGRGLRLTEKAGLRSLIDELLTKLRSVEAIGEPIVVAGGRPPG